MREHKRGPPSPLNPIEPSLKLRSSYSPLVTKPTLLILFLIAAAAGIIALGLPRAKTQVHTPPGSPRIAALSPALAVTLRDLGLSDLIVARHGYDMVLDESIPVGLDRELDYEQLLAAHPSHILLQLQSSKRPARLDQLAASNHWQVLDFSILTLDDIRTSTTQLAELFAPGADKPLIRQMDSAWSRRPNIFTGRILLLAGLDPPSALGPGSWHHQILERIGGAPAITQGSPYITLDAEDVLSMKPDAILVILPRGRDAPPSSPTTDDLRRQLGRLGTLDMPAVTNSRIALIDHPLAHTPSSAMIGLADQMTEILTGWK